MKGFRYSFAAVAPATTAKAFVMLLILIVPSTVQGAPAQGELMVHTGTGTGLRSSGVTVSGSGGAHGAGTNINSGSITLTNLTASSTLVTDSTKKLVAATNTGTGSFVLQISPSITTPTLSTPVVSGSIELSHATANTLTGSGGFATIEGKPVSSPASAAGGDVQYFDGTQWVRLPKGTAGQVLEMNAGATAPEWDTDDSSQTPWTSDIDADEFSLTNITSIVGTGSSTTVIDNATSGIFMIGTHFVTNGWILNIDNGDLTLTHSANTLTLVGGDLVVPTEAYDATGWNGDNSVPTKDAVRDKIEAITTSPADADYLVGTANGNLSAEIVVGTSPGGELGGTWASPTLDDNLTVSGWTMQGTTTLGTVAGAIDAGTATSFEIPNGNDPDLTVEGQISYDANEDVLRAYDGANQVAIARKIEAIHVTVISPNDLVDSERDAFWIWSNESGMSFIVTGWKAWSDTDDTDLNIEEIDADGQNNATVDAVTIATNGTGLFTGSDTTITAATIENGHLLVLDFDDTDTPGQVKITIYGYYNADVN